VAKSVFTLDYDFDFEVISIVSSVKEYRLCLVLNNLFGFDMYRLPDLEIQLKKKKNIAIFNIFHHYDDIDKMNYYLIGNKFESELLLPELKMVDYVLKLEGFKAAEIKEEMITKLKTAAPIQAVFNTSLDSLKDKTNLLF
jgi:hypothetical protein